MADFSTPDDMAVEEVVTKTRNKALPRQLLIDADGQFVRAEYIKGRIDSGELVDQSKVLIWLRDTVDDEGNPDKTDWTDWRNSQALGTWIRSQPNAPTTVEIERQHMYLIGKLAGLNA